MSWYSDEDARFDAWVTGNWGEDSVQRETPEGMSYCDCCGELFHNDQVIDSSEYNLGDYDIACYGCFIRVIRAAK